jgi:hypothetical protein
MPIPPKELGRLAILQKEPLRYVERRVEHLDLVDDYHYGVSVIQQIQSPLHGEKTATAETELLIPLGQFSKDRIPDLRVEGPTGERLALLTRAERGELGAALFTSEWAKVFFKDVPKADRAHAMEVWATIRALVARAVSGSKREAEIMLKALDQMIVTWQRPGNYPRSVREALRKWSGNSQVREALQGLEETRLLVAKMRGVPGRSYPVTVRYTERFDYAGHPRSYSGKRIVQEVLAWLGMLSWPIKREVANMGQAASLWIVQSVPDGVEALRYHWRSDRYRRMQPDPVSIEATRAVTSYHPTPIQKATENELRLEVQLAPSPALTALIGLAGLLLVVATYVYQAIPTVTHTGPLSPDSVLTGWGEALGTGGAPDSGDRVLLVGLGSVFAAVPAAIAGALAYKGQTFTRRISRGPRALVSLLCVMAAFFAVVVSLKNLGDWAEGTAYVVSLYSFWLLGVAAFIQWGPRWRKNEKSRWTWRTRNASPVDCRRHQVRSALLFLTVWTLLTVLFARLQVELQTEHFFTSDFPGNIWDALF